MRVKKIKCGNCGTENWVDPYKTTACKKRELYDKESIQAWFRMAEKYISQFKNKEKRIFIVA